MYQMHKKSCKDSPGSLPSPTMESILLNVPTMKVSHHRARGLPASTDGFMLSVKYPLRSRCGVVMSSGNSVSFSCRDSLGGYAGSVAASLGTGGMGEAGVGDVSAYTRAAATESA